MEYGEVINFKSSKPLKYIKELGSGGSGDTHLFLDEVTNLHFAIKKYVPKYEDYTGEDFIRFVDEIKILFHIAHPNIVRVYNYYLYPENKTGFLQMEYVDGISIDKFQGNSDKDWNDLFNEAILAFKYLEEHKILHRDIRPQNILINESGNLKVIDFGFGKQLTGEHSAQSNSVILNWPVSESPSEITNDGSYDSSTEVYFVGKLFEKLIQDYNDFRYEAIISKMIIVNQDKRYSCFADVAIDISKGEFELLRFTDEERKTYLSFAEGLSNCIECYTSEQDFKDNPDIILDRLERLIHNSVLEITLQDNGGLIQCFVNSGYRYWNTRRNEILVEAIKTFYKMLKRFSREQQQIAVDNIITRLKQIKVNETIDGNDDDDDDLPF